MGRVATHQLPAVLRRWLHARHSALNQSQQLTPLHYALTPRSWGRFLSFHAKSAPFSSHQSSWTLLSPSMRYRISAGIAAAAAVASGAWYYSALKYPLRADSAREMPTNSVNPTAAHQSRHALVVEDGSLFSSPIPGSEPLSKTTDQYGRQVYEMLTPDQANEKLRQNEESWHVRRGNGVVRYDVVQIPSNNPIEDDHAEKIIHIPNTTDPPAAPGADGSDWMFWGVFDGHSGWTTSAKLRQSLIPYVARELNDTYISALKTNGAESAPPPEAIDAAIKAGFVRLDNEIVLDSVEKVDAAKSKRFAAEILAPALSGSCALLSFYDSTSKTLRVACTGDSRAVLGRKGPNGKWTATPLSVDQTGSNDDEARRLQAEHPGEADVVLNGRVLGYLEPTRAFGDAVYKWTIDTMKKLHQSYFVRSSNNRRRRTPPYVTAEPEVTTSRIQPENGDFVVMATDGLWEMLTNEEVVGLVGRWMEVYHADDKKSRTSLPSLLPYSWSNGGWFQRSTELPVEQSPDGNFGKQPFRRSQWGIGDNHDRFVYKDYNVATHLARNAMGGKDDEQLCALLTLTSPYARRFRDDLTISVIFFGKDSGEGNVVLNERASWPLRTLKSKL